MKNLTALNISLCYENNMYMKQLVVVLMLVFMSAWSHEGKSRRRKPKFLSFNTLDGDVSVDLEFSIPFVSIPVKKTMDAAFGESGLSLPQVNINVAGLALGAVVVLGTIFVIPLVLKTAASHYPNQHYAKVLENTRFGSEYVLDLANQVITDGQGLQRCALKVACWAGHQSTDVDSERLMRQISSNSLLSAMINTTAMEDAIFTGRRRQDCSVYNPCPLGDNHMPFLLHNLMGLTHTHDSKGNH